MVRVTVGVKQSTLVSSYHITGKVYPGVKGTCEVLIGITKPSYIFPPMVSVVCHTQLWEPFGGSDTCLEYHKA